MNLTDRLIDHDACLTERLLEGGATLTDEQLDGPAQPGGATVPEVSSETIRGLLHRLVFADVGPKFRAVVTDVEARSAWDTTFVDTACEPAETFTYGCAFAHVVTMNAYRRELAVGALRRLGVEGLGYGDPIRWGQPPATPAP